MSKGSDQFNFLVSLKENNNAVDVINHILLFFAIIIFSYFIFINHSTYAFYLILTLLLTATWIITVYYKKKHGYALFRYALLLAAVGWIAGNEKNIFLFILYIVAAMLEKRVKQKSTIQFSTEHIYVNKLPIKIIQWKDVSNIKLKDGLLTIDFKSNRLYQKDIEEDVNEDYEKNFNEFCKQQIDKQI